MGFGLWLLAYTSLSSDAVVASTTWTFCCIFLLRLLCANNLQIVSHLKLFIDSILEFKNLLRNQSLVETRTLSYLLIKVSMKKKIFKRISIV